MIWSLTNDLGTDSGDSPREGLRLLRDPPDAAPLTPASATLEQVNALQLEALNAIAFPVVAVRGDRHIVFANRVGQAALQAGEWIRQQNGRIDAGRHLREPTSLACALGQFRNGRAFSVLVTDSAKGGEAMLSLVPVQEPFPTAGTGSAGLLWLIPMTAQSAPVGEFGRVYNLTRAEQRVLQRLLAGDELRTAARTIHISIHTARNHLKSILQKTGRRNQSQLLASATRVAALQFPGFWGTA